MPPISMNAPVIPPPDSVPADLPPFERGLWARTWFMALLCCVFVGLDWELLPLAVFPFVFVFPVMLVAWNRPLWQSAICAGLLSLTRIFHQQLFGEKTLQVDDLGDGLICFFVLQLLAVLTTQLGRQSRLLRQRVKALEGLLPICSFCKSIRNEKNEWQRFEEYITAHSGAVVSHGLCPDCAKQHYGDFLTKK